MGSTWDLTAELHGKLCRCGKPKMSMHSFCALCYYALPQYLRQRLYQGVGDGYEAAHAQAVTWLDRVKDITT